MAINKVVYGDTPLIDLTEDTVSPEKLMAGETAHDRSGEEIEGTLITNEVEEVPYEDYQELTPEEQADGSIRFIPNYPSIAGRPGAAAGEVGYDNSTTGLPNNVQGAIDKTTGNITALNTVELTATAAHAHAVKSTFLWIGQLVKATAAIAVGDTIAIGTNVEPTSVLDLLRDVDEKTNDAIGDDVSIVISPTGVTMISYNCIHISNKQLFVSFSFVSTSEIASGTTFMHFEKNGSILALSNKRMDAACVRQNGNDETGFVGLLSKSPTSNSFFINGRTFLNGFYLCTCILDLQ